MKILSLIALLGALNVMGADIDGTYNTVFSYKNSKFFNRGEITVTKIQAGNKPVFASTVKINFGDKNANEFLVYDFGFDECQMVLGSNILSCKNAKADVSIVGTIDGSTSSFKGYWFSKLVGQVGPFEASKQDEPKTAADAIPVSAVSGYYQGPVTKTNASIPLSIDDLALTLSVSQDTSSAEPKIVLNASVRVYLGSTFYNVQVKDTQFNFYSRFLTVRTEQTDDLAGMMLRGYLSNDGTYAATVVLDGVGTLGTVEMKLK